MSDKSNDLDTRPIYLENKLGLKISDTEWSVAQLTAELEKKLAHRQQRSTTPPIKFPSFGYQAPFPEPCEHTIEYMTLYHYLRQLNELEELKVTLVLAESDALRIPFWGRLWRLVREQAHRLVLFYVNRVVAHETIVNSYTISLLNEMTRLIQNQQQEIAQLRTEIAHLQDGSADET